MKTLTKIFVTAIFAVAMSFFTGCKTTSNLQNASQNFGAGKNFFESYGIKTEGTYVAGRIVAAENRTIDGIYGRYITLDSGKEFFIAHTDKYESFPFIYVTEKNKSLHRGKPNTYDATTVQNLYIEAMVNDGVSYQFVYYDYANHQSAQNFMKNTTKTKTEKSSLEIVNYGNNKYFGGPKETGKSKVVEVVEYFGIENFTNWHLSNGTVLTIRKSKQNGLLRDGRALIKKDNIVSYVLSDMKGSDSHDGTDPYTNTLDYVVE